MTIKKILQRHPLKGTPKQKEWAQIIRAKKAKQLEEIGFTGILRLIRPHLSSEKLDAIGCDTHRKMKQMGWWVCEIALWNEEASWWIGVRDEDPTKWIGETAVRQIQEWIRTKPF